MDALFEEDKAADKAHELLDKMGSGEVPKDELDKMSEQEMEAMVHAAEAQLENEKVEAAALEEKIASMPDGPEKDAANKKLQDKQAEIQQHADEVHKLEAEAQLENEKVEAAALEENIASMPDGPEKDAANKKLQDKQAEIQQHADEVHKLEDYEQKREAEAQLENEKVEAA